MSWFLWSTCQIYFFNKDLVIGLNNESQKKKKTNKEYSEESVTSVIIF